MSRAAISSPKLSRGPVQLPAVTSGPRAPVQPAVDVARSRAVPGTQKSSFGASTFGAVALEVEALALPTDPTSTLSVEARILVISPTGDEASEPSLGAIRRVLDYLGTPYTLWNVSQRAGAGGLTAAHLRTGARGHYQGVILTSGDLYYSHPERGWVTDFTPQDWENLFAYEAEFGIRQITLYTYPSPAYGFQWPTGGGACSSPTTMPAGLTCPLAATFTSAGQAVFARVNTANPLVISPYAWGYFAQLDPAPAGGTAVTLLEAGGYALAVLRTYVDGRENVALTFDNAKWLEHSLRLGYDLVNWVTRGLFLGQRRTYLAAQVDDLFIYDDLWDPAASCNQGEGAGGQFRMTSSDLASVKAWQDAFLTRPVAGTSFKYNFAFNGQGTDPRLWDDDENPLPNPDTLTPSVAALDTAFRFINHSLTHLNLDGDDDGNGVISPLEMQSLPTVKIVEEEFKDNNKIADKLKLRDYSKRSAVTPDVSGLQSAVAMKGLEKADVRYVVSNTSILNLTGTMPPPNNGHINALEPKILELPRYPTNLFYNVSTPAEWVAEYNCLYGPGGPWAYWPRDLTYAEILDEESFWMLQYLLRGDVYPLMFHQANLRDYSAGATLLGDLMEATYQKYASMMTMPFVSLSMDDLGEAMSRRMAYDASGAVAVIGPGRVIRLTTTAATAVYVPVTGVLTRDGETYAGEASSWVRVDHGHVVTLTLP